jgi:hypothetical protein
VYTDQSESVQLHDFNPGFGPDVGGGARTFWTAAIPDSDVTVQFGAGKAEMNVQNLALQDRFTIPNALGPNWATNFDPATVSFDVVWSAPITRSLSFTDSTDVDQFTGNYNQNQVTVNWSGTNLNTGFSFTANPGTLATSSVDGGFAELGQEQNGSFFSGGSSPRGIARAGSALAQALTAPVATPASTTTTLVAPPQRAAGPAAISTGSSQAIQPASGLVQPGAAAAHAQAIDQLFADLDGNALASTF